MINYFLLAIAVILNFILFFQIQYMMGIVLSFHHTKYQPNKS